MDGVPTDFADWASSLGALFYVGIALMVVFVIVDVIILVWVYKDAEAREMGGALWLVIVLCGNCIGCLIFFIVRGNHPK